ncbi:DEAD-box ATP-dependent RNA helicase 24 [Chlorella sorokiniana]|uniref:RNA helicase n=1 Tax=Chlorella sorokiniana TaxID=3076 RepID=A0A2P6TYF0_CHLSO|nr:DEAD-box ATP-dependent RNA helicase 24 [Chlorella sorokiniana]|eukprot:PRW59097.1 DEAD-box ATP-dependent RNA helicase 24 [Chlorella sorokiniana]
MSGPDKKRAFPYYSEVQGFEVQRRRLEDDPSRDAAAPRVWQAREQSSFDEYDAITGDVYAAAAAAVGTDFRQWSEEDVRAFLDQRGEDFDDCHDFESLVKRAQECEANTGPAQRPDLSGAAAGGAGGGAGGETAAGGAGAAAEEEELDPLDAFMAEIGQMEKAEGSKPKVDRMEAEDTVEAFVQARKRGQLNANFVAAAAAGSGYGSDDEGVRRMAAAVDAATGAPGAGYDSDDAGVKKDIEALAALDHDGMAYADFNKDFYEESPEVAAMSHPEVAEYRRQLGVRVSGFDAPRPVRSFVQCGFDAPLMQAITKAGYQQPTAIQAQALPAALSGRDVLGIAKTGSGKTAAFVLPMLVHIMDQPELAKGEGPIAVIVAPTRELAEQIHKEARRFGKPYGLSVCAAFGGLNKHQQFKDLKAGCEVAVCTPGRMIDLVKMKACTMKRATYLVFDEADRMFDMGFEPQVRSIMGQIRPDRQTLLFSATMPRKVERLAGDALTSPVRITVGEVGGANEDIKQVVEVLHDAGMKQTWVLDRLQRFIDDGDVLVFANQKAKVDELTAALQAAGARVAAIHGDMDQHTRMTTLHDFKAGKFHALVATDVAARGLDIKSIKTVVNYDAAKDIDTHVHRIGRTGRAGDKEGVAYTLLLPHETRIASDLVQNLAAAGQEVPPMLHELAARDPRFRKGMARGKGGRGGRGGRGRGQVGGAGLGFGGGGGGGGRGAAVPPPPSVLAAAAAVSAKAAAAAAVAAATPVAPAPGGMAGFARSHGGDDAHFASGGRGAEDAAAAAAARTGFVREPSTMQTAPPLPPVPRGFAAAAAQPPAGYQQQQQGQPPPPPPPQQQQQWGGAQQGQQSQPWGQAQQGQQAQQAPLPPQPQEPPPEANTVAAVRAEFQAASRAAKQNYYSQSFQSGFVSSGTRSGDIESKPEIVLPKSFRPQAAVPPPPVPVHQQPLYLQRQQPGFGRGGGGTSGYRPAGHPVAFQQQAAPAQPSAAQSAAVQAAIEQAKAIAARLAGQAPGGQPGGGQGGQPGGQQQWQWGSRS